MSTPRRFRRSIAPAIAVGFTTFVFAIVARTVLQAQSSPSENVKLQPFLVATEKTTADSSDDETPTPKPKSAKPKTKKATATATPKKSPAAKRKTVARDEDEDETPAPNKKSTPSKSKHSKKSPTPSKKSRSSTKKSDEEQESPKPSASRQPAEPSVSPAKAESNPEPSVARAIAVPNSGASTSPADITVEKSGLEQDQGLEPPPPPPPRRSFLARLFGARESTANYRYLTRSVVEALRRAPVQRGRWKFIIVHNSGTRQGNARAFDYYHRHVRRMQNGLAYHFVIGNGTSSGNGQIEIGDRWRRQINGGHVHSDYLNNISLGICLVGDFNRDQPTRAQLDSCDELIRYLRQRCGRADGREIPVRPHREMNPPQYATDCPGDVFPYAWFRRF